MRINCACGCGHVLTGKQRKFWSDACRKRFHRKADSEDVRESPENSLPVFWQVDISQFADTTLSANGEHKRHLVQCLQADLDYQEVWCNRLLAQPSYSVEQLELHQFAVQALRALVDSLVTL